MVDKKSCPSLLFQCSHGAIFNRVSVTCLARKEKRKKHAPSTAPLISSTYGGEKFSLHMLNFLWTKREWRQCKSSSPLRRSENRTKGEVPRRYKQSQQHELYVSRKWYKYRRTFAGMDGVMAVRIISKVENWGTGNAWRLWHALCGHNLAYNSKPPLLIINKNVLCFVSFTSSPCLFFMNVLGNEV